MITEREFLERARLDQGDPFDLDRRGMAHPGPSRRRDRLHRNGSRARQPDPRSQGQDGRERRGTRRDPAPSGSDACAETRARGRPQFRARATGAAWRLIVPASSALDELGLSAGVQASRIETGVQHSSEGGNPCFCRRRSSGHTRNPNGSSTGPSSPAAFRRGFGRRSFGASPSRISPRPRTTRPSSRSGRRKTPASTSSPTARSVARATRTASRPRSKASTSTSRA